MVARMAGVEGVESMSQQELEKQMDLKLSSQMSGMANTSSSSSSGSANGSSPASDGGDALAKAMKLIADGAKNVQKSMGPGSGGASGGGEGDDMLEKLFQEFEKMSRDEAGGGSAGGGPANGDVDKMVEKMMQELVSKEYLYEPMKDVCDRYPKWLEENKGKHSNEDYDKYVQQYGCFKRVVAALEEVPENKEKLFLLMTEVQNYGPPPQELVGDMLPGFGMGPPGADGMPPMPSFGNMGGALERMMRGAGGAGTGAEGAPSTAQMKEMEKMMEGGCPTQ